MAYMDDTAFIKHSKEGIDRIIRILTEFYELNDIRINAEKTDLLIFNSLSNDSQKFIKIGSPPKIVLPITTEARYLGVWFSSKDTKRKLLFLKRIYILASIRTRFIQEFYKLLVYRH